MNLNYAVKHDRSKSMEDFKVFFTTCLLLFQRLGRNYYIFKVTFFRGLPKKNYSRRIEKSRM